MKRLYGRARAIIISDKYRMQTFRLEPERRQDMRVRSEEYIKMAGAVVKTERNRSRG